MSSSNIDQTFFQQPLKIGTLTVPNRVLLSPLAGVSDVPFRRICRELGASLGYVEMLSAVAVNRRTRRTMNIIKRHPDETQVGVQVTGSTPEEVSEAAAILEAEGFDTIDINMGCPVRKIVNKGWGSAILKEPDRVYETVKQVREAVKVPVSAKLRIGYSQATLNAAETGQRVIDAGADMITFHGRTKEDVYGTPVNYEQIRAGLEPGCAKGVATMGNGNVMDFDSACHMVKETHCDAVLISRGALGNPWIFSHIIEGNNEQPTVEEWRDVVLRHIEYTEDYYGTTEHNAIRFRKHLLWYVSGFPHARKMRPELVSVNTLSEVRDRIRSYADQLPNDLRRYEDTWHDSMTEEFDPKYDMDRKHDRGVGDDE